MTPHVTRLLLAQHVLFINIWSDDSVCFVFGSLTDNGFYFNTHVQIKFCPDCKKSFSTPLRCKIHDQGKLQARQMQTANPRPCNRNSTSARSLIGSSPGSPRTLPVPGLPNDRRQRPKTCLINWLLQTVWPVEQSTSFGPVESSG